jgi:hypothetical protein
MIDSYQREASAKSKGLRVAHPDKQRSYQAGPLGYCDSIDFIQCDTGITESFFDDRIDLGQMITRRDFRNDAAERLVKLDLRRDHRRKYLAAVAHNGCGRFVAGTLDPEY